MALEDNKIEGFELLDTDKDKLEKALSEATHWVAYINDFIRDKVKGEPYEALMELVNRARYNLWKLRHATGFVDVKEYQAIDCHYCETPVNLGDVYTYKVKDDKAICCNKCFDEHVESKAGRWAMP